MRKLTTQPKGGMNMDIDAIQKERAMEQLRQEREAFDQRKYQESRWFCLRLAMGFSSVALIVAVVLTAPYVLFHSSTFPTSVVISEGAALPGALGLLFGVWKIVLNPNFMSPLTPTTSAALLQPDAGRRRNEPAGKRSEDISATQTSALTRCEVFRAILLPPQ
jgi:hypothetical protein